MAGHFDPAQPRDHRGEWTGGGSSGPSDLSGAVSGHVTGKPSGPAKKPAAAKAPEPDLSTREGRLAAMRGADVTTPQGRSLFRKAQRAQEDSFSPSAAAKAANARTMFGPSGKPPPRGKKATVRRPAKGGGK